MKLVNYYITYKPCIGTMPMNAAIPNNDETPISCHRKYVTTIALKGPTHKNCIKCIAISNLLTSFDIKFTTWPTVVSPRDVLLNRNAWMRKIILYN